MVSRCCCSHPVLIYNNFLAPENMLKEKYAGEKYQDHPVMSRIVAVPIGFLSGAVKPFLFPLFTAVGIVAFPIIAIVQKCRGENYNTGFFRHKPKEYLKAWAFSLLSVAGIAGVMALTSSVMPLIATAALVMTFFVISISVHIYYAAKAPQVINPQIMDN